MRSVGYDIVDLSLTDPGRNARPQFYRQILAPADTTSVLSFHRHLWLCWSVKEAVYKYVCRLQPGCTFSPTRMVLESLAGDFQGRVRWEGRTYHTRSSVMPGYIASIAHDDAAVRTEVFRVGADDDPSLAVRQLLLASLEPGWTVERRADGCPTLVRPADAAALGLAPAALPVSFSHHGAYAGFALPA
jgi:phosphopantetheinyl transferase (holo-ACP synthase)